MTRFVIKTAGNIRVTRMKIRENRSPLSLEVSNESNAVIDVSAKVIRRR